MYCLDAIVNEDIKRKPYETSMKYILRTTGPGLLTSAYDTYPNKEYISVISHTKVDSVSWCDYETYDCAHNSCGKYYPETYSIHHYGSKHNSHNWTNNIEKNIGLIYCRHKKTVYLLLLLIPIVFFYIMFR